MKISSYSANNSLSLLFIINLLLQPGQSGHAPTLANNKPHVKHIKTQNAFARLNTKQRGTRYAGHGPVPGQLATVHRTGQNRRPGTPQRGNGKPGKRGNQETRTSRDLMHFYLGMRFFSSRNASTHHDLMIR